MPSHYMNHADLLSVDAAEYNFQWKFTWNSNILIQENALENVIRKMLSILFKP